MSTSFQLDTDPFSDRPEPRNSRRGDKESTVRSPRQQDLPLRRPLRGHGVLGDVQRLQRGQLAALPGQPAVVDLRPAAHRRHRSGGSSSGSDSISERPVTRQRRSRSVEDGDVICCKADGGRRRLAARDTDAHGRSDVATACRARPLSRSRPGGPAEGGRRQGRAPGRSRDGHGRDATRSSSSKANGSGRSVPSMPIPAGRRGHRSLEADGAAGAGRCAHAPWR